MLFYGSHGTTILEPGDDEPHRLSALLTVFEDEFGSVDTMQCERLRTLLERLIIVKPAPTFSRHTASAHRCS